MNFVNDAFLEENNIPYLPPAHSTVRCKLADGQKKECGVFDTASFFTDSYMDSGDFTVTNLGSDDDTGHAVARAIEPSSPLA